MGVVDIEMVPLLVSLFLLPYVYALSDDVYHILSELSNKSLVCKSPMNIAPLSVGNTWQMFELTYLQTDNGYAYEVKCINPGRCWDYRWSDGKIGHEDCKTGNGDQWYKFRLRSGTQHSYEIIWTGKSKYFEVGTTADGSEVLTTTVRSQDPTQYFTVIPVTTANPTTIDPTIHPTIEPTIEPTTEPSIEPTKNPTTDPTQRPVNLPMAVSSTASISLVARHTKYNPHHTNHIRTYTGTNPPTSWISVSILSGFSTVVLCVIGFVFVNKYKRQKNKQLQISSELEVGLYQQMNDSASQLIIGHAMVILLAIGEYRDAQEDADDGLKGGIPNLNGLDKDIKNLRRAFGADNLNYTIYSPYNEDETPKLDWTENEIVEFLRHKANLLENNLDIFDGLIVAISCHGLKGHICTTDCKMIEKTAIHRIFSQTHPQLRTTPRIFMFDCCDGRFDCKRSKVSKVSKDQSKGFSLADVEAGCEDPWSDDEENPDYRLIEINAANPGFQSKLNTRKGSYMLSGFAEKIIENLNNGKVQYIYEIFDDIEQDLLNKRKQQIEKSYNNKTRYVILKRHEQESLSVEGDEEEEHMDNDDI